MGSPGQQAAGRRALGGGGRQFGGSGNGRTGGALGSPRASTDTMQNAAANPTPLNPLQRDVLKRTADATNALNEAAKQRKQNKPFVQGAETVLGMLPGPVSMLGTALKVGDWMGAASESALSKQNQTNPGSVSVDKNVPGSVYGRINGMMFSNRADVPGYNGTNGPRGLGKQASNADLNINPLRPKKVKTVLSTPALGTAANPMGIA